MVSVNENSNVDSTNTAAKTAVRKPRWKRVLKRIAIGFAVLIGLLVIAAVLVYNFGGMSGSVHPELLTQYNQMVAAGQEPPLHKRFVIPIPGCQCHSTDPVLTAQHSVWHMSECGKCHDTQPAHMEPGVG
jgi:hypothetical protein